MLQFSCIIENKTLALVDEDQNAGGDVVSIAEYGNDQHVIHLCACAFIRCTACEGASGRFERLWPFKCNARRHHLRSIAESREKGQQNAALINASARRRSFADLGGGERLIFEYKPGVWTMHLDMFSRSHGFDHDAVVQWDLDVTVHLPARESGSVGTLFVWPHFLALEGNFGPVCTGSVQLPLLHAGLQARHHVCANENRVRSTGLGLALLPHMLLAKGSLASEKNGCVFTRHDVDCILHDAIDEKINIGLSAGRKRRSAGRDNACTEHDHVSAESRSTTKDLSDNRIQHHVECIQERNRHKIAQRDANRQRLAIRGILSPAFQDTTEQTRRRVSLAVARTACCVRSARGSKSSSQLVLPALVVIAGPAQ